MYTKFAPSALRLRIMRKHGQKYIFIFFYLAICVDSLESASHRRMVQISRYQRHLLLKLSFVFSIEKVCKRNHGGGPVRSPGIFVCSLKNILSCAERQMQYYCVIIVWMLDDCALWTIIQRWIAFYWIWINFTFVWYFFLCLLLHRISWLVFNLVKM